MAVKQKTQAEGYNISTFGVDEKPFYMEVGNEVEIAKAAFKKKIPLLLKGPTGCGKSRFVNYLSWLFNQENNAKLPLITVLCNDAVDEDYLQGRFLISGGFQDGPALTAVKTGGILYLDELTKARSDAHTVVYSLTDDRRYLVVSRLGKVFNAPDNFMVAASYNPGYHRKTQDLEQSMRQRFIALDFDYAPAKIEQDIILHESGIDEENAHLLRKIAEKVRNLKEQGLEEGASTRLLVYAGSLIRESIPAKDACRVALLSPITDDKDARRGLEEVLKIFFQ
ncbi:CbbQ/NirQ/NorQ/GpvN family protein [Candidatus Woesearchaeota archaeon]|nr:CbbQ/NirQ/NorQ/GpvN family protein [Candidatus Woesearchaeota archaeon]